MCHPAPVHLRQVGDRRDDAAVSPREGSRPAGGQASITAVVMVIDHLDGVEQPSWQPAADAGPTRHHGKGRIRSAPVHGDVHGSGSTSGLLRRRGRDGLATFTRLPALPLPHPQQPRRRRHRNDAEPDIVIRRLLLAKFATQLAGGASRLAALLIARSLMSNKLALLSSLFGPCHRARRSAIHAANFWFGH
jgi:hypothetical protein